MPPFLANPSSFLEILVEPGERIYFSKRDASAYFDTLRAPEALQPYFGRPCVTVLELMNATGLSQEEIRNYVVDHPDSVTVNTKVSLRRLCGQWVSLGVHLLGSLVCCRLQKMQELLMKIS